MSPFRSLMALACVCPLALMISACADDEGTLVKPGDTAEGDTADTDDTDISDDAPWIESAEAWCYEHTKGDTYWNWIAGAQVDDPQGKNTVKSFDLNYNLVTAMTSQGAEIATYALACSNGSCTTTFRESSHGITCQGAASTFRFSFQVVDDDGNVSAPYEVSGEER